MSLRSCFALSALALLFGAIGYGLFGVEGATGALAIGCIGLAADLRSSSYVLERLGAREITDSNFIWWARDLADRAGVSCPRFFEVYDDRPNAATAGLTQTSCSIILFGDIRRRLTRDELAAVIGHELGHIAARDIQVRALCGFMVWATISSAVALTVLAALARRGGAVFVVGIAVVTGIVALSLRVVLSHGQEYDADRVGAEIAGPRNMISALQKLETAATRRSSVVEKHPRLVVATVVDARSRPWRFSTHPPLHKRIARLQRADRTMQRAAV